MSNYFYLVIWWVVFFALHSILASSHLKRRINKLHPSVKSYYRLIFNLVSTVLLLPIGFEYHTLPSEYFFVTSLVYQIPGCLLSIAGIYIIIDGFKNYRTDEFLGTYQIKNNHDFYPARLSRSRWNAIVRHPLYFGGILIAIGLLLIIPTVKLALTSLLVIAYFYIGSIWEEGKLKSEFGADYEDYQREVSMLLPLKWAIKKLRNW